MIPIYRAKKINGIPCISRIASRHSIVGRVAGHRSAVAWRDFDVRSSDQDQTGIRPGISTTERAV